MNIERRIFEREAVAIRFIYSLGEGNSLLEGDWSEAETVDMGPVLVGGLSFYSDDPIPPNTPIRIALFMDLELRKVWEKEQEGFPMIYHGTTCRLTEENGKHRVAIVFLGFERDLA